MNNTYKITATSPLLRPGLVIETECSEKYLAKVVAELLEQIRAINAPPKAS